MSELNSLLQEIGLLAEPGQTVGVPAQELVEELGGFFPRAPESLREVPVSVELIESLVLKYLLNRGCAPGRDIAEQLGLPFRVLADYMLVIKREQLVAHRSASGMNDFLYELTENGHARARRASETTTYFGALPVTLDEYVASVESQSLQNQKPGPQDLMEALKDLTLPPKTMGQIGQAVRSARAMFLFGSPGNGKTSIAQRITSAFGDEIWLPKALSVDGEIVRVFDPVVHEPLPCANANEIDNRWIRIRRPTITAGGELTLENLEMTVVGTTGIIEAPLQLKSNCGVLLIDDFGRQRCSPTDLLNRWIVPLETQVDFLNMPSGKKVRVPFEQMIVFSTNLAPKDLVDEAFLRRIPYKVEAPDPTQEEFHRVFGIVAEKMGIRFDEAAYRHLLLAHYAPNAERPKPRGFRYCHVRDLLTQIKTLCEFHDQTPVMTPQTIDMAVENYFVSYGVDDDPDATCAVKAG